jgi:DeoR/GlpR family transcriptional regulator of sugar metabolism
MPRRSWCDGASLIIDCGSTTQALAQALLAHRQLTSTPTTCNVARPLRGRNGNVVHVLGGQVLEREDATAGWETVAQVAQYHVDFAFVGVGALRRRRHADRLPARRRRAAEPDAGGGAGAGAARRQDKFEGEGRSRSATVDKTRHLVTDDRRSRASPAVRAAGSSHVAR